MARLLFIFLLLFSAGCVQPDRTDERIELTFWTISLSPSYDAYINGLIQEYEAGHPGVSVKWVDLPQQVSRQKLMAGIAAGQPPDLVNTSTEFALTLAQNGAICELDDVVPATQQDEYFENIWNAVRYQGKVYAIPWYVTTKVLIYNKDLLQEAGLDPSRPPQTTEELDAMARQVTEKTKSVGMMPTIRIWDDWSMSDCPTLDLGTLTPLFTAPESVAAVERYRKLYAQGVMPPETLTEGYQGALDRYKAGSLAFLEAGPQLLLRVKADAPSVYAATGIWPLPLSRADILPASTMNFVVPRASKHRQEAIELGLFLTSPGAQVEFCKLVPILPSTKSSTHDPYFQSPGVDPLQDEAVRISLAQLPKAHDLNLPLPRRKDLMRSLKDAVEKSIRGEQDTSQALHQAAEEWSALLAPFQSEPGSVLQTGNEHKP